MAGVGALGIGKEGVQPWAGEFGDFAKPHRIRREIERKESGVIGRVVAIGVNHDGLNFSVAQKIPGRNARASHHPLSLDQARGGA